ncbi:division/cell wall cluster transcriptional repressor MraZ [Cytophagales bacterium LB-30]|uniref:Transcriptional regulator MraZ n=1 Tax=Shiella aurantiaca TaxID=3058365 RepID=A0ABT8F2B1_9BACT|nr:division/cell wall cluster transcriptional repressor MraZ [Shiella aurantiaca]MDN4164433.1 division/cell wall cluster transcriptional repressor MraZ [Shiella aurantiaca]
MSFFTGEYECKLDAKGRLVLPARIKSHLPETTGNELVLRKGFEACLVIYPLVEYKKIFSKIAGLSEFNEEYRTLQRNFFRGNTTVELDTMGRFVIPKLMLSYSGIDKDALVIGMGNRIEVWSPTLFEQVMIKDQSELSKLAQKYLDE